MALIKKNWIPFAVCALGMVLAFHPMILSGLDEVQVNLGDTRLVNYIFEHSYLWLKGSPLHAEFTNWPVFFPSPNIGASTETLLGTAPLYWAMRFVGIEADTTLQFWMLIVSALNFLVTYFFLTRVFKLGALGSSAGAFLFAFGGIRIAQAGHQQLLPQFSSILAIWGLIRVFEGRQRARWIPVFFLATAHQLYTGFYLGWFLVFGLLLAALLSLCIRPLRHSLIEVIRQSPWQFAIWGAVSAALLFPMARIYLGAAQASGVWGWSDTSAMVPRLQSWFYMGPESWLYSWTTRIKMFQAIPMEHEHRIGLGLITPLFVILGLRHVRGEGSKRLLWLLFWSVPLLSTYWIFRDLTLWHLPFQFVPGGRAIRAVSRIALLFLIPASIGLALFIEHMERKKGALIAGALFLVCALEQAQTTEHYNKFDARERVALIEEQFDETPCDYFLFSPILDAQAKVKEEHFQIDAMWASLRTNIPTLNGYAGRFPAGWHLFSVGIRNSADEVRLSEAIHNWIAVRGIDRQGFCWIRGTSKRRQLDQNEAGE